MLAMFLRPVPPNGTIYDPIRYSGLTCSFWCPPFPVLVMASDFTDMFAMFRNYGTCAHIIVPVSCNHGIRDTGMGLGTVMLMVGTLYCGNEIKVRLCA